jgi:hypothetical protein
MFLYINNSKQIIRCILTIASADFLNQLIASHES